MRHGALIALSLILLASGVAFAGDAPPGAKGGHDDHTRPASPAGGASGQLVRGSYIVRFADGSDAPGLARRLSADHGFQVRHVYRHGTSGMAVQIPAHAADRVLEALRRNPRVRSIGNDMRGVGSAQLLPKGIDRVNAEPGKTANTGAGIRIAIVDSGLDFRHPDFGAAIETTLSVDCVNVAGCGAGGQDDNGHGTFVAGVAAARDNLQDVVGAAPDASLVSVKVLGADNTGTASDFIAGLDHVAGLNRNGQQVDVANISIVFTCSVCTDDSTNSTAQAMHDVIRAVVAGGTTVVVSAGNDSQDARTTLPAAYDEVITVSALNDSDGEPGNESFAWFSNFGEDIDLIAPGVGETSLRLGVGTRTGSGTSFASPVVAGVAAVYIRDYLTLNGTRPSPATVRTALIEAGECASGAFHDGLGCDRIWDGDPDGIPEPLVRGDFLAGFSDPQPDIAATGLDVATPVMAGETKAVILSLVNEGGTSETVSARLSIAGSDVAPAQQVALSPGQSTVVSFSWTPAEAGDVTLTATADPVTGETDTGDNSRSVPVTVQSADISDMAIAGIDAAPTGNIGDTIPVAVDVRNAGTRHEPVTVSLADTPPSGGVAGSTSPAQLVTVAAASTVRLTFDWDTSMASPGDHTLTAEVALDVNTDTDPANNIGAAVVSLGAQDTAPAADTAYVGGQSWQVRTRGRGGRTADLLGTVSVRQDSDGDGMAEDSDQPVKEGSVAIVVIRDSDADGDFDCGSDQCWTASASVSGSGDAKFQIKDVPAGLFEARVSDISAPGMVYDASLDRANPVVFNAP